MKRIFLTSILLGSALGAFASPEPRGDFTAHEWGTFTSVQAADGTQLQWNPVRPEELPRFVYSLAWPEGRQAGKPAAFMPKGAFLALQRMETPVIYFYSDHPQSVDVGVKFPEGIVTEWFPRATQANRFSERDLRDPLRNGLLKWDRVDILGKEEPATGLRDDSSGKHYFAARETDANLLRINSTKGSEIERFLFYRGVGEFKAPLTVSQEGSNAETIQLKNAGQDELRALFIYQVQNGRAAWTLFPRLAPGETKTANLDFAKRAVAARDFQQTVIPELKRALVAEGLYELEAGAMIKTWEDSWFTESGARVLYVLPRAWTDQVLPLTIKPGAKETVRVMIGRAELITPKVELSLAREAARYVEGDLSTRASAVTNTRDLGLGRFGEVVLRRVLANTLWSQEFKDRSWQLLQEVATAESKVAKPLAQR